MTAGGVTPFPEDALDTNRSGRITDAQKSNLRGIDRAFRKNELTAAAMCAIIGLLLLTSTGPAPNAWLRPIVGPACFVVAVFFLYRAMPGGDSLSQDLRTGTVETIEGALGRRSFTTHGKSSSITHYYFDVAGKSFEVSGSAFHAAPEAGIVRIYYMPRSKKVVNLEHLPDRLLPPDALTSPTVALHDLATSIKAHDPVERAEARAQIAAIETGMKTQLDSIRKAPAGERDPRPLAESIIGSWRAGPVLMAFAADGTLQMGTAGLMRDGHWSVDAQGRLHADGAGQNQVAEAWITGESLVISEGENVITFTRANPS